MTDHIFRFALDESGGATLDWVVLTAGIAVLGLTTVTLIRISTIEHAGTITGDVTVSVGD